MKVFINLTVLIIMATITSNLKAQTQKGATSQSQAEELSTYVIERNLQGAGALSAAELKTISQGSCAVIKQLGPEIKWLHSYVTENKIFCVYQATNAELLRKHAEMGGFPIDAVHTLTNTISPATAE